MERRPLTQLVALCLLRWAELCGQQVLSNEIRRRSNDYLIVSLDNVSIRTTVKLWIWDKREASFLLLLPHPLHTSPY